jgi:hypothetical protein
MQYVNMDWEVSGRGMEEEAEDKIREQLVVSLICLARDCGLLWQLERLNDLAQTDLMISEDSYRIAVKRILDDS